MSSLQSLETQRGIRSCRSQVNGAALQKQPRLALAVLGLCSPSRRSVPGKGLRIVWLWRLNGLERGSWWVRRESWGAMEELCPELLAPRDCLKFVPCLSPAASEPVSLQGGGEGGGQGGRPPWEGLLQSAQPCHGASCEPRLWASRRGC